MTNLTDPEALVAAVLANPTACQALKHLFSLPVARVLAPNTPTLRAALEAHLQKMAASECQPASIRTFAYETELHLGVWLDLPLSEITRAACRERHREITASSGPYAANRVFKHLRALWRTAGTMDDVPPDPTQAIFWNKEHRRQEPIPWGKLPEVYRSMMQISPVRRDYYRTVLLTGLRRNDAATIRWDHIDFGAGTLHRPNPKGGKGRAFTLPLSTHLLDILHGRKVENAAHGDDRGWVFPSRPVRRSMACDDCAGLGLPPHEAGNVSHLVERKQQHRDRRTATTIKVLPSPHRFRDTFTTALAELDPPVSPFIVDTLTNHRPPKGSVTAGYINLGVDALAKAQERATTFLLEKAGAR